MYTSLPYIQLKILIMERKQVAMFYHSATPPYCFQSPIVLNLAKNGAINIVKAIYIMLDTLHGHIQRVQD